MLSNGRNVGFHFGEAGEDKLAQGAVSIQQHGVTKGGASVRDLFPVAQVASCLKGTLDAGFHVGDCASERTYFTHSEFFAGCPQRTSAWVVTRSFLSKPYTDKDLLDAITQLLRR